MTDVLKTAIRNLEGKASVAHDKMHFHLGRLEHHRGLAEQQSKEMIRYTTAIEALKEVMGVSPASLVFDDAVDAVVLGLSEEAPKPQNNGAHKESPSHFDREAVIRELRARKIRYPLAVSHRYIWNFIRQSEIAAVVNHPGYRKYLTGGGYDLLNPRQKSVPHIQHAIDALHIDARKVADDAAVLHGLVYSLGEEGRDYR